MTRKSRATSASERAEVGSSMIRIAASNMSALAISTICWSPIRRSATRARGLIGVPSRSNISRARRSIARLSTSPNRPVISRPRKMFAATVRSGTRFSSWWMIRMPASSASRGPAKATGLPSRTICPSKSVIAPARIFMSVLLPAPFSPQSEWTSPARARKVTPSRAWTPPKCLVI